eukprot:5328793-Pyramimonas_sp.AAC.1
MAQPKGGRFMFFRRRRAQPTMAQSSRASTASRDSAFPLHLPSTHRHGHPGPAPLHRPSPHALPHRFGRCPIRGATMVEQLWPD